MIDVRATALALLAVTLSPIAAPEAPPYALDADALLARVADANGGALPERVLVDAGHGPREADTADVVAFLRALSRDAGAAPADGHEDAGVGFADERCAFAAVASAMTLWGGRQRSFRFEAPRVIAPAPDLPCFAVARSWLGSGAAVAQPGASTSACVGAGEAGLGRFVHSGDLCRRAFSRVEAEGRVAYASVYWGWSSGWMDLVLAGPTEDRAPHGAAVAVVRVEGRAA